MGFRYVTRCLGARGEGDDVVAVRERGDARLVVVADGAGGTGSGRRAAMHVVDGLLSAVAWPESGEGCAEVLQDSDAALAGTGWGAETTAVLVVCRGRVAGGCIGG